jgi:hypothetical protein
MSPQNTDPTESNTPNSARDAGLLAPINRRPLPIFDTIEAAAPKLGVEPGALRSRCQRAARRAGPAAVAQLGGGIVAFKFGKTWRVRFPNL